MHRRRPAEPEPGRADRCGSKPDSVQWAISRVQHVGPLDDGREVGPLPVGLDPAKPLIGPARGGPSPVPADHESPEDLVRVSPGSDAGLAARFRLDFAFAEMIRLDRNPHFDPKCTSNTAGAPRAPS